MYIQNEFLTASFNARGAELCSLRDKNGKEYIWDAQAAHWARHAPILFPIVGKLKDNKMTYKGTEYAMNQHGFARDRVFKMLEKTATSIKFGLRHDEDTLEVFPFAFTIHIIYTLKENQLEVAYHVKNPDTEKLYFSIGAHPAFNCPLEDGKKRSDYQFVFEKAITADTYRITNGNQNGEKERVITKKKELQITDDLFEKDALVFKNFPSSSVGIAEVGKTPYVNMHFKGFPFLGLWSASKDAPFVCIEPWLGIADTVEGQEDFSKKEGVIEVAPKEAFDASYTIEINA
ncbi:aldose 1-epimerase family protein [Sediminitomix flava]|uniref:Galactose mutarotase-like enzyme n=1 Tax=Sediminitomix flava TaxID=379075 RepID=A0A315ZHS8_SEDFL|nr:aldose 1-epimerase family protein [Sediminitomix flava]PWJ44769.1 galactose mutarotase-like enzyme [Sediminitomix flava]